MANPKTTSVALLQASCSESPAENLQRTLARIAECAGQGAEVICLQELFHLQYPCQSEMHERFQDAEPIPGPTLKALCSAASEHRVAIIGSLFERRGAGVYHNTAVVIDHDGELCGVYRKMHIPDDPLYYEKFYFAPGDLGFRSFPTSAGQLGVCVCWDQWFPEAARLTALTGAEIIFYPTAIGWLPDEKETYGPSQQDAWETMLRSHAIANGVFVAAPNRVGREGELEFWGRSLIVDPYGVVLARGSDQEQAVIAECDLSLVNEARVHWPFLRDRRIDAYRGLSQRWLDGSQ